MTDRPSILLGIPVYNEQDHVTTVLSEVRRHTTAIRDVLVVDDGSTDDTPLLLANQPVEVIRHAANRGYGHSTRHMLRWAVFEGHDWLITMDCDEQHEPAAIPRFVERIQQDCSDIISGSRYLEPSGLNDSPPPDRRAINAAITAELNGRLGLDLTDSFCGFKAYRISACRRLSLDLDGYEFPMQFWVQAAARGLRIEELEVRLIYGDPNRSFGGPLNDPVTRLQHYRRTIAREISRCDMSLPPAARHRRPVGTASCPTACTG